MFISDRLLLFFHSQQLFHLFVVKALAWGIGLDPFSIDDKLRDGAPAGVLYHLFGRGGIVFDVNLFVGDLVLVQEALGFAAVRAPGSRINGQFHRDSDSKTLARDSGSCHGLKDLLLQTVILSDIERSEWESKNPFVC